MTKQRQATKQLFKNSEHTKLPGADLYRGDCLALIPALPGSFDAVVTDPPYSSGGQSMSDRARPTGAKYVNSASRANFADFAGDSKDQRAYLHWSALWMGLCFEKLTPGGLAIVFADWRQLPVTTDALQAAGFTWRGIVPWDKLSGRPYKGGFRAQCEYVVWGSKGPLASDIYSPGLFRVSATGGEKLHQVGKPLALMEDLIKACGKRILDPFMGSATTGLASLNQGKEFTGMELSPHYYQVALQRLKEATKKQRD